MRRPPNQRLGDRRLGPVVRFGERDYFVEEVVDQWYGLDGSYFKLRADVGNVYVLRHDTATDEWTLEATKSELNGFSSGSTKTAGELIGRAQ